MNYNSLASIQKRIKTLKGLKDLIDARHKAYYERKEDLKQFLILGTWHLDTCGNCWTIIGESLDVEPVIDLEFSGFPKRSFSLHNSIVPAHVKCFKCRQPFSIKDAKTIIKKRLQPQIVDLSKYIGQSIKEVKEIYKNKTDAQYYIRNESGLQNDKFIDTRIKEGCTVLEENHGGWIDFPPDYIIDKGDKTETEIFAYYHKKCFEKSIIDQAETFRKTKGKDADHFKNLAGDVYCDYWIKAELEIVGLKYKEVVSTGEVSYKFEGRYKDFEFRRAWTYWVVNGFVPLKIAQEIYADEVGQKYVRVAGHCGCVAPEEPWIQDSAIGKCVTSYHIDTLQGLKLFVSKIKE